ncbi:MAG TPA: UMP kinase, partial [Magnetospirillaceae bacterium]|nr:UMP kinase [Magnetospirillaceae bacterium]
RATLGAMKLTYTRILVKISGEQLAGKDGFGFDPRIAKQIAGEIAQVVALGAEVVVIVGGGNFMRGAVGAGDGLKRVTADFMGMLGGVMNAVATADVFNAQSVPAYALSPVMVEQMIDYYTQRRALHHLRKRRVVVIGGGIARPYFTHDTAAVSLALELDCDVVVKVTKVDGVYSRDPAKHADATRIDRMTFDQAVSDPEIKVMDKAALGLAMEQGKKIIVCDLDTPGNLTKLVSGETIGTLIS